MAFEEPFGLLGCFRPVTFHGLARIHRLGRIYAEQADSDLFAGNVSTNSVSVYDLRDLIIGLRVYDDIATRNLDTMDKEKTHKDDKSCTKTARGCRGYSLAIIFAIHTVSDWQIARLFRASKYSIPTDNPD